MPNDLKVKIVSDGIDKVTKEVEGLTKEVEGLTKSNKTFGTTSKDIDGVTKGLDGLATTMKGLVAAAASFGIAKEAWDLASDAAKAQQAGEAFQKIFTDMGKVANDEFSKIKESSKGLIPDDEIKQSAVTAASLGVPIKNLAELMEVARAKSREMGTTTASAFADLATGIGRGSPMILDNLGLTIKLEEANQKMAASLGKTVEQLTKQEKAQALTNAVIEAGSDSVKRYADAGLSVSEMQQKMNADIENLKGTIGNALLPAFEKLITVVSEWSKSISAEDINDATLSIQLLTKAVIKLNDAMAPDKLFGDGAGFFGQMALGAEVLIKSLEKIIYIADDVTESAARLGEQSNSVDGLATAVSNFTNRSISEFNALQAALVETHQKNSELIEQWSRRDPETYADSISKLTQKNKELMVIYGDLAKKKPFEENIKDIIVAGKETERLNELTKKYTDDRVKEILKANDKEIKDSTKKVDSLLKNEEKLSNDIAKLHEDLVNKIKDLENERFNTIYDIENKINDIKYQGLGEADQYYQKQKDAETALSQAKQALYAGDLEKYKTYIKQYESLATENAGHAIEKEGAVLVSKEETARVAINALNNIKGLENQYYTEKEARATAAHDLEVAQKQIELEAIQAQLEGQRALLAGMEALAKAPVSNLPAFDAAIAKVEALKQKLAEVSQAPAKVNTDTTSVEQAKQKVAELKTLTLNGVELNVDADTKPADFGIKKLITKSEGDEISMEVNPEYEKAQKQIDNFREGEKDKPIPIELQPETAKLDIKVTEAKKPVDKKVDFKPDTAAADRARDKVAKPIIVPVTYIPTNSPPQGASPGFASGGYTGSGLNWDVAGLVHKNEFVFPANVTKAIGVDRLYAMMRSKSIPKLPGYQTGGLVGSAPSTSSQLQPINLNIGGKSFDMMSDRAVAEALQRYIKSEGGE